MLKLNLDFQVQLLKQPESGMGYQIVEAVTSDYKTKRGIAYNAEFLLIQYGIVEPANDQLGGGVEVIFTKGTDPGTVTGREKIPDE